jgi:sec-independent protein translocase protein TatC
VSDERPVAGRSPRPPHDQIEPPGGPPAAADEFADGSMSLIEHLEELRSTLIQSFAAAAVATAVCWFFSARLLDLLVQPIAAHGVYFTAPNEAFLTRIKISIVVGFFLVLPFIFFKFYGFVIPGLYTRERRLVTPLLIASTGLFYLGVAFAFLVVTPQVIRFMLGFGTTTMEPLIGIGPYFAFVSRLCLAFGLVFELPLVVLFLSVMGVVDPRRLLGTWRYAVVLIALFAAMLTPPDVASQLLMAVPVLILYVGSVLVAMVITRRRDGRDDGADDGVADDGSGDRGDGD